MIDTKYYYVKYETKDREHEYQESGVLRAMDYKLAIKKVSRAKRLFNRYGRKEFCVCDEIREISSIEYGVSKRFILNIDSYFDENLTL